MAGEQYERYARILLDPARRHLRLCLTQHVLVFSDSQISQAACIETNGKRRHQRYAFAMVQCLVKTSYCPILLLHIMQEMAVPT